jgi:DNA-binding transcriptional MerR regulator
VAQVHLSIGEVLALLQGDFPDVTISKIRFLESQGLLDPERTPSGYRKFYETDVERLRWILHQQREHFLPLKVIKDRLAEIDAGIREAEKPDDVSEVSEDGGAEGGEGATPVPIWMEDVDRSEEVLDLRDREDRPAASPRPRSPRVAARAAAPAASPAATTVVAGPLDRGPTTVSLSLEELASASGLTPAQLTDLVQFGLVAGRNIGGEDVYGDDALVIAQKAAAFIRHGVEPRHLKQYRVAAEREAGLLEQVVMPLAKRRAPTAHREAVQTLSELAQLGQGLHAALLRQALPDSLTGR